MKPITSDMLACRAWWCSHMVVTVLTHGQQVFSDPARSLHKAVQSSLQKLRYMDFSFADFPTPDPGPEEHGSRSASAQREISSSRLVSNLSPAKLRRSRMLQLRLLCIAQLLSPCCLRCPHLPGPPRYPQ